MRLSLDGLLDTLRNPLEAGSRQERAALAFLAGDGCPACHLAAESEERWVKYYVVQGNTEPEVFQAIRAALGPCGRHRRRLVAARNGADVYASTAVFLAREALKRAGTGHVPAQCPPCEREAWAEEHAVDTLLRTLHRPAVADRLGAAQGFCLPHLLQVLSRRLAPETAIRLAGLGCSALGRPPGPALLARLCGRDDDAPARAELLRAATLPPRGESIHDWLLAVFAMGECPSCLAERAAVHGALTWVGAGAEQESWELRLCPDHLATLAALDPAAADKASAGLAAEWTSALARYIEALTALRGIGARILRRTPLEAAREKLLGVRACRACDVRRTAGERMLALIEAALRDRSLSEAYTRSHGLCWRHLAGAGPTTRQGVAGETLQARLALLGWELEEAQRKRSWFARWETAGGEAVSWRRLPALLGEPHSGGRNAGWARAPRER
jgi:hypothetical protein